MRVVVPGVRPGDRLRMRARWGDRVSRRVAVVREATVPERRAACNPHGSRMVAGNEAYRVFEHHVLYVEFACAYDSGAWAQLTYYWFHSASFQIREPYLVFGATSDCLGDYPDSCVHSVHVFHLRTWRFLSVEDTTRLRGGFVGDHGSEHLTATVITVDGAVAWTQCIAENPCPAEPERAVEVLRLDRRGLRRLAISRHIDPHSLRLTRRGTVTWRQRGQLRAAPIAGPRAQGYACASEVRARRPLGCPNDDPPEDW